MQGGPVWPTQIIEDIPNRPGEEGRRTRKLGITGVTIEFQTFEVVDEEDSSHNAHEAQECEKRYKAIVGYSVTIIDGHSESWCSCVILGVSAHVRPIIYGGSSAYEVRGHWKARKEPCSHSADP